MAYCIVEKKNKGRYEITAILDSAADLDDLGTNYAPGSVAIVADRGAPTYMLNASKLWKEI